MAIWVASGIWPLVLIHTSVVMECVANSSLPPPLMPAAFPLGSGYPLLFFKEGLGFVPGP